MMPAENCLRFVPTRVEGLPDVTEVAVFPDRLELFSAGRWVAFAFDDIAQWPRPRWLWRVLARVEWRRHWPPVADRDWFHPSGERFFAFYTRPPVVIFVPDEAGMEYGQTYFRRVQEVILSGGFNTSDLG